MTSAETEGTTTVTIRLPSDLYQRIKERAEAVDRSVNWMIRNLAQVFFDNEDTRSVDTAWPDQSPGRWLFGVTLRWYMPDYDDLTTDRIDRAIGAATRALRDVGADDGITVDGPWKEIPMDWRPPSDQPLYGTDVRVVDRYPRPGFINPPNT